VIVSFGCAAEEQRKGGEGVYYLFSSPFHSRGIFLATGGEDLFILKP
jgi:hypothetical protein